MKVKSIVKTINGRNRGTVVGFDGTQVLVIWMVGDKKSSFALKYDKGELEVV